MTRSYTRRSRDCRVCGVELEIGVSTTARLSKYSFCTRCTLAEACTVKGVLVRWCGCHTRFEPLENFKVSLSTL